MLQQILSNELKFDRSSVKLETASLSGVNGMSPSNEPVTSERVGSKTTELVETSLTKAVACSPINTWAGF